MNQEMERRDALPHEQRRARRPWGQSERFRRRPGDGPIAGITAGLAHFVGADPRHVRAVFVVTVPLSLGVTAFGYLLLWGLLPVEPST